MSEHLFLFLQLEFPWELGPPDGRYILRSRAGSDPERVIVLETLGARVRSSWRGQHTRRATRAARGRAVDPEPPPTAVPTSRATIIDPTPVSAERQAQAWLRELDIERTVRAEVATLNRVLHVQRISSADPYLHEVSAEQALVIRAGWGDGEHVADGKWLYARELRVGEPARGGARKRGRGARVAALRSQERFAELLGARSKVLLCEEFALRARLDLDHGRTAHAALELANAYRAALKELREERFPELELRVSELEALAPALAPDLARASTRARPAPPPGTDTAETADAAETAANAERRASAEAPASATPKAGSSDASADAHSQPDEDTIRHALERLEAAIRARAVASGSRVE